MPVYGRIGAMRRGAVSLRRRYSNKRRKGGLKRAAVKKTKAPVSTGYSRKGGLKTQYQMRQISDTCVRITGRSYLGAVSNTGAGSNAIGLLFDINPVLLGDRVAVVASTYDKYCYQNMKFTYVPQCPTSQPGSVMCVFERDPESILANTQSSSYMQEVMSYEHAVLTPAWVSTSVTYKRDPHEVKTWFTGGDNATLSPRETSQGLFIAYVSNASSANQAAAGKLGFVVMDYILDLVSPNILPNKVNVTTPSQYAQLTDFGLQNGGTQCSVGTYQQQFLTTVGYGSGNAAGSGQIVEVVLDGGAGSTANNGQSISDLLQAGVSSSGTTTVGTKVLSSGSRFYLTRCRAWNSATGTPGTTNVWVASSTLADAIGAVGLNGAQQASYQNSSSTQQFMPVFLACAQGYSGGTWAGWGANNIISQQQAWVRTINAPNLGMSTA